jgi:hypothetical protein
MKKSCDLLIVALLAIVIAWSGCTIAAPVTIYVSPTGSDAATGLNPNTSDSSSSGPVATFNRALTLIRTYNSSFSPRSIIFRGGYYFVPTGVTLNATDSGLIISNYPGEQVTLSGGRRISGNAFRPVKDPSLLARLPATARSSVVVVSLPDAANVTNYGSYSKRNSGQDGALHLYYKTKPMTVARWPNAPDYAKIGDVAGFSFNYSANTRPDGWDASNEVWIVGFFCKDWYSSHEKAIINRSNHTISMLPPGPRHCRGSVIKDQKIFYYNVFEELDSPGEFYVNRTTGQLFFWPPTPITGDYDVLVSVTGGVLITIDGALDVVIKGFTIEGLRGKSMRINGSSSHNLITECTIRNVGLSGINIEGTGVNNTVSFSKVYNVGSTAIDLNGGDRKTLIPASNRVISCEIFTYALWDWTYNPGIGVSGVGQIAQHNKIFDAPHNAIHADGNNHLIEYNIIHDVCLLTGDVGAFYIGRDWTARGTEIRFNFFYNIHGPGKGGAVAVYHDDQNSGVIVYGNVFYNTNLVLLLGGGRDNTFDNNLMINNSICIHADGRGLPWGKPQNNETLYKNLATVPYDSPPWSIEYPSLASILRDPDGPHAPKGNTFNNNIGIGCGKDIVYYDDSEIYYNQSLLSGHNVFEKAYSSVASQMVDPKNLNFQFVKDAAILQKNATGFVRIPFEQIGLLHDKTVGALGAPS